MSIRICGSLFLDCESFGEFDRDLVIPMLKCMAENIDRLTRPIKGVPVIVFKSEFGASYFRPLRICGDQYHYIGIMMPEADNYAQWAFVFPHEFMHHSINRPPQTQIYPTLWFDEVLCNMSFLANSEHFPDSPIREVVSNTIRNIQTLSCRSLPALSIRNGEGIRAYVHPRPQSLLKISRLSNAAASQIYPLFRQNPDLWRIVPHIREIPLDADSDSFFGYLRDTADDCYRESLDELVKMLLP